MVDRYFFAIDKSLYSFLVDDLVDRDLFAIDKPLYRLLINDLVDRYRFVFNEPLYRLLINDLVDRYAAVGIVDNLLDFIGVDYFININVIDGDLCQFVFIDQFVGRIVIQKLLNRDLAVLYQTGLVRDRNLSATVNADVAGQFRKFALFLQIGLQIGYVNKLFNLSDKRITVGSLDHILHLTCRVGKLDDFVCGDGTVWHCDQVLYFVVINDLGNVDR